MDLWLQEKFVLLLSNRLERFARNSPRLFQCRCPFCGDSEKDPTKRRGYFYVKGQDYHYHCHNCNKGGFFEKILKELDPSLYYEMKKESFGESNFKEEFKEKIKDSAKFGNEILKQLEPISELSLSHPAYKYLRERKVPSKKFQELYYCENFKEFVNPLEEEPRFKSDKHAIPRIIIPFFDRNGVLFGFQGRALNPKEEIRYISIILDDSKPKAYGLNHIDFNKKYYVFEGPFDSMFIENSLAVCGSDALSVLNSINCNKQHAVIVFDNEPRNKQIANSINRFIELGWSISIWPDSWEYKDVNDAVKAGITPTIINHIIDENTYSGLVAKLKFTQWRKDAA